MKSELQRKLILKFPRFFTTDQKIYIGNEPMMEEVNELLNQKEIVSPIQFGVECGDGWYMLIEQLMENMESHLNPENTWPRKERIPLEIIPNKHNIAYLKTKSRKLGHILSFKKGRNEQWGKQLKVS